MLKTMKPEDMTNATGTPANAVVRLNPDAIAAALRRTRRGTFKACQMCGHEFVTHGDARRYCPRCSAVARANQEATRAREQSSEEKLQRKRDYKREYMRQYREQRRAMYRAERGTSEHVTQNEPRTSAHWHFKVAADGRPTCHIPTLAEPTGRHIRIAVRGHETALEAMDRCVTGWGDAEHPSKKLQWRDE